MKPKINKNRSSSHKQIFYPIECRPQNISTSLSKIVALNPPGNARQNVRIIRGEEWEKMLDHPKWIHAGYVAAPTTPFQTFVYHFCMGALMHYPLFSILRFCLQKDSLEPWLDDPVPNPPINKIKKVSRKIIRGLRETFVKSSPIAIHIY